MEHNIGRRARRKLPIFKEISAAWRKLDGSEWLTDFRYGLLLETDEISQGRETNLYAILDPGKPRAIKLGIANDVRARLGQAQVTNPRDLVLLAYCPATENLERFIHAYLAYWRIRGEWFCVCPEVLAIVELIASAEDLAEDLVRNDGGEADCGYTLGAMYGFLDTYLCVADQILVPKDGT